MKNLTITLTEDTLSRIRVAAAKEGKSMSRFVAELVESRVGRQMTQKEALEQFLAGPDLPGAASSFNREELYAERTDRVFRRHEHPPVSEGPSGNAERGGGASPDRRARRA